MSKKDETANAAALDVQTVRNLSDKLYEKRKQGAMDIEQQVKEMLASGDKRKLVTLIEYLSESFVYSSNANHRKGGLIALAAVAIGLSSEAFKWLTELVLPVLTCFTDQDSRVRYYACESMYNIAKVSRGRILIFFNELFDGLTKLSADPDVNVKNGAQLLDRLIKDIVAESENFDIDKFMPLLQERVYALNPFVRKFLIGWLTVLDSVPSIDLNQHLPKFLDGLFKMLSDTKKDIRLEADNAISEFLHELQRGDADSADFGALVAIVMVHCVGADDFTRLIAISWLRALIEFGGAAMLPYAAEMVGGILPGLSDDIADIQEETVKANQALLALITRADADSASFPISDFLRTVSEQFVNAYAPTRMAALRWILLLHQKAPQMLESFLDDLFPQLLKTLSDPAEEVVRLDLEVMAKISANEDYFARLMHSLVSLCATDRALLEARGPLIIRQLSLFIDAEKIYRQLAIILERHDDVEFASTLVESLSLILLSSAELAELRASLRQLTERPEQRRDLFVALYRSWCHNPAAAFCLCLLAQCYEHAAAIVACFAEMELTVNFLVSIDKLVQLLESPVFASLRLQLLEPRRYPSLLKSLFGILMLLPQSPAFELLKNRLSAVASLGALLPADSSPAASQASPLDYAPLLEHFKQVQQRHRSKSLYSSSSSASSSTKR
jgi:vacuole morphology and inheritance protein 14